MAQWTHDATSCDLRRSYYLALVFRGLDNQLARGLRKYVRKAT
jgi:hypothetical protein